MSKKQNSPRLNSAEEQLDENKPLLPSPQGNETPTPAQIHQSAPRSKDAQLTVQEDEEKHISTNFQNEDNEVDPNPSPYERASTLNTIHYIYVIRHLCKLRNKKTEPITLDDTPKLGKTEEVNCKINEIETAYQNYLEKHKNPSLFWPLLRVFWVSILKNILLVAIFWAANILIVLCLCKLLDEIDAGNKEETYKWTVYMIIAVLVNSYAVHYSFHQSQRLVAQMRPALMGMMYKKITRLSSHAINQASIGKIVNIAANDLNILDLQAVYAIILIVVPFGLGASLALLWSLVGIASLPGIVYLIMISLKQYGLAKLGAKYVKQKNLVTDERVKLTNEMIEGIRPLKMYGWGSQRIDSITKIRNQESSLLTKILLCDTVGEHLFVRLSPILGTFLIFITYWWMGGILTASKVYSVLLLLRGDLVQQSSLGLRSVAEIRLIFRRIIQFLEVDEHAAALEQKINQPLDESNGVEFDNFSAFWGEKSASENPKQDGDTLSFNCPTLKRLNFSVKRGTLCAIIGRVGSGKTTALLSLLNEIPKVIGDLRYSGRIAYVEQEPSIFPGTVRNNILFGKPYDEIKYNQVVEAACLIDDFEEFPSGDMTEIGEKGVNLSGGQKARTSLARALYSDADIYLLDDPLSAVDTKVAKTIFQKAIRGVLKNKTVLLVTHQVHFAREVEKIVLLENGELKAEGTLDEIITQDANVLSIFEARNKAAASISDGNLRMSSRSNASSSRRSSYVTEEAQLSDDQASIDETTEEDCEKELKGKLIIQEKDESVRVGWNTYWFYIQNAGSFWPILFFILILSMVEVLCVMYMGYLGYWAEGTWTPIFTIKVLGIVIIALFLFLILREFLFVKFGINASKQLHIKMLQRVTRAKVEFFDTNPSGRILNRFSNDLGILDRFILQVQNDIIDIAFYCTALFVTTCAVVPWILLAGLILAIFIGIFTNFLKTGIIQGRGVELLTRSPIYSLFSLTLSGLTAIRVYGQENKFIREFTLLLNRNARAFTFYNDVSRTLAFYVHLSCRIFACTGIVVLLYAGKVNTSLIGLVICYLLSYTNQIQLATRQSLLHLMQMGSTERIRAYTELQQEPPSTLASDTRLKENNSWPSKGEIQFNNVYMKYRENTEHILKGLTFSVNPSEKIGCVGRTGSGKSSIIQTLFRMVEIDKKAVPDASVRIDNVDIFEIGLDTLRKSISIIPQTPFTFTETVKKNLDPLGEYGDAKIITALEESGLWNYINSLPEGLNTTISNTSSLFSTGQKQLLCLARALLQNNKIIVLDEATSNVDFETDNFIQSKIMERFRESTVFTIAHRLSTVAHYDRVMVMDKGRVKEFDHPYKLLVRNIGDEMITRSEGLFASMVLNTGVRHSGVIFQNARSSYFQKFEK